MAWYAFFNGVLFGASIWGLILLRYHRQHVRILTEHIDLLTRHNRYLQYRIDQADDGAGDN